MMEQCFADTRQWARAVQLLDDMKTAGSQPDAVCYNGAIHACAKVSSAAYC
jgi:pentatricopeptide repeat protein